MREPIFLAEKMRRLSMGTGLGHRDERTQVRVNAKTIANMYSPTTSAEERTIM